MPMNELERLVQLREKITDAFDDDELRTLCFDLGVDYDDLLGEGKKGKARELVAYCDRHDLLWKLVEQCRKHNPDFDWGGALAASRLIGVPPMPDQPIIGRHGLLSDLRARLLSGGAVALSALNGLPGVGKTTLAVALAHDEQILAHFSGGVLWAGLGKNPAVDDILNEWATALGVDPSTVTDTAARAKLVERAIARRGPMLLVIDDAWSIDAANTLRQAAPDSTCLLTTRLPALAAEFAPRGIFAVHELSQDDALSLLAQFAPQACEADQRDDAVRLVRAVGCLPLAIVLTGRALAVEAHAGQPRRIRQAYERLSHAEERMKIEKPLTPGQAPVSLLAAIRISDEAIGDDAARRAFWALSAFAPKPADFSEEAALAVAQCETSLLDRLVDLGLMEVTGLRNERYTLHQEIAHYAELMLDEDFTPREEHVLYYLDFVNQDPHAWQRIEPELVQIRFAWSQLTSPSPGAWKEGLKGEALVFHYVRVMDVFLGLRGLWDENLAWCKRVLEVARVLGLRKNEGDILNDIAWCYNALGEPQHALEYYEQALAIAQEVRDQIDEAVTLNNIGRTYYELGEHKCALEFYEQALSQSRSEGSRKIEAMALNNIGMLYHHLGEHHRALEYLKLALAIRHKVGDLAEEAHTLTNIGLVYSALDEPHRALDYYERGLSLCLKAGDRAAEATALSNAGTVYEKLGQHHRALECCERALYLSREMRNRHREAVALTQIGRLYYETDDTRRALEYVKQALDIHREMGDRRGEAETLYNIGHIYFAEGDAVQSPEYFKQALRIAKEIGYAELVRSVYDTVCRAKAMAERAMRSKSTTPDDESSG